MGAEQTHIDVARIMRQIRDETRARHGEIERLIERAQRQLTDQIPHLSDEQLAHHIGTLNTLFDGYYDKVAAYLREQEPNYANIRYTLSEISRVLEEPQAPRGQLDRWWNPRHWFKRVLVPFRRFVLRQQNDVNALFRDTLTYLVNHSGHVELQRMELEMGVQLVRAMAELLKQVEATRRYFKELPRVSQRPVFEHVDDTLERFGELQKEEHEKVFLNERQRIREEVGKFCSESGALIARLERRVSEIAPSSAGDVVGFDNLAFADGMRGDEGTIHDLQLRYVRYLKDRDNVLDAGCGRGELLAVLREHGIPAYGVDRDENMVSACREKGLDARCEDILDHLAGLPDRSLGGVVALQLIEHFPFPQFIQFFRLVGRKVREDGVAIFETVNPSCLTVFSGAFYADPSHQRPVHPEAARQMLEMVGFGSTQIDYINPISAGDKLECLTETAFSDEALKEAARTLNKNMTRLNSVLYGFADYAVIGRKTTEN